MISCLLFQTKSWSSRIKREWELCREGQKVGIRSILRNESGDLIMAFFHYVDSDKSYNQTKALVV